MHVEDVPRRRSRSGTKDKLSLVRPERRLTGKPLFPAALRPVPSAWCPVFLGPRRPERLPCPAASGPGRKKTGCGCGGDLCSGKGSGSPWHPCFRPKQRAAAPTALELRHPLPSQTRQPQPGSHTGSPPRKRGQGGRAQLGGGGFAPVGVVEVKRLRHSVTVRL